MQPDDLTELQNLIEKLDSVYSVKLTADPDGNLCEIHVLSDKSKSPKQISRDIQSAVAARTGQDIEHRIISIAQVDSDTIPKQERLKISGLETTNTEGSFSATVILAGKADEYRGQASEVNAMVARRKVLAIASINAIHDYLKSCPFSLSDIQKFHIAGSDEINVAIHYYCNGSARLLTGTALIVDDEYSAVIKATLDAVNRVIPVTLS
ncbi:hypothetical protein [Ethanoligenens harbinense]|uniref:hypothetical protein n=1 Tax=Ethanoligenens harbinense TaxID=253239 RepID=UPI0005A2F1B7|nr:hypothetical protein [Ethanoligenens harbinense]AVQ95363.1 hypothetical protein CXQ68_03385 [Ethanoligenens harbinense YUAN-3]AYF38029.1 hypothetical protein CXP51_03250 [Ethanoligenens harbinense]AYF40774.1 hypothetical protein CN246_03385 [Ethanoligenens harbinense]QCN91605.1 hypothetical protein DRA42_03390 [Ethanoligenens harbinense]